MVSSVFRALSTAPFCQPRLTRPVISSASSAASGLNAARATDRFVRIASTQPVRTISTSGAERSALQKHVDFFDRNNDGKITYSETRQGLMALGIGGARASAFALAINAGLSRATGASFWEPLTIYTDEIARGKHGSDTDIFDEQGHFSQLKFDELFQKYDLDQDNALCESEFKNFRIRNFEDETSSLASKLEFDLLMELAGEPHSTSAQQVLTRERLAEFYDGTLFYKIAGEPIPFP